ncbi:MAG: hypothetical protein B6I36_08055, partial [Desulfobacteraceae bacterium 4572_35.1]
MVASCATCQQKAQQVKAMQTNIDFWPTTLKLKNSSDLICDESLRYLAGKRLVCRGRWQQRTVAVKLFFHPKSAKRHWLREKQGVESLISNQLSTPSLLFAGTLIDGTPVLIFDYLSSAKTALDVWKELDNDEARLDLLQQIVVEISAQHRCGLWQQDLHLGNFLISDNQIYTIDGDGIKSSTDGKELTTKKRRNNLALLLAQLSPNYDHLATPAIEHYAATSQKNMRDLKSITEKELPHIRTTRRHKYVKKAYRNCSEFIRHNSLRQVAIYRRDADAGLIKQFLNNPDQLITDGTILKNGNSATVAQVTIAGDSLAIKRYNIKGIWHILKRCWRPTRAWISWGNAHRLTISGIDTPQPIAILEKRLGPLRTSSYYLCVHENTPSATDYF